jgi:DNA-binding NarL/FixJ family response regulator
LSLTIVVAHDHEICRQGLRLLLEGQEDFHVMAEATEGRETLQLVQTLAPQILVVDLMMSDLSGLEITRRVRRSAPTTRVVLLSTYADEAHVVDALRSGVCGYVRKGASATSLFQAVREANAGGLYLSPPLSDRPIETYLSQAQQAFMEPYETLTAHEREVLYLAARGLTNREIAIALFISQRTVETHRANFMRKLNLRTQADMIRYALQRGIIPWES